MAALAGVLLDMLWGWWSVAVMLALCLVLWVLWRAAEHRERP
jgi:hypothetical protein